VTLFIAGATGFIGSHLIRALKPADFNIRCLVRNIKTDDYCKSSGFDAVYGDITDRESLKGRLDGSDIAVHLVGVIEEKGDATFQKVHVEGTKNLVDEAKNAGVKHIFYQSALGASLSSNSSYQRTKAEAEEIVKASGIPFTIFRPSLVIGDRDGFTEKLKELIAIGPVVAVPGAGNARLQPVYIGDWIKCFLKIFSNPLHITHYASRIYDIGGPEHLTYNEILEQLMEAMDIKKKIVHLPMSIMKAALPFIGLSMKLGSFFGKNIPSVTAEQLELLQRDNICDIDSVEKQFGFKPIAYREALTLFIRPK
jgi:NADH dehydrogenase